jgi:HD-GYP domain-containing protein (c-di-GMP phosphodiesterase class II)
MLRFAPILVGALTGGLLARERRIRQNLERLGAATLESLLDAIAANNPETGAHVRRVAGFALILADAADLDDRECHNVERVALFHDIGKLDGAITDIIVGAKRLTPEEWEAVRTHPQRGADVLRPLSAFYPDLGEGVLAHHERWDGSGYPRKLRGYEIPLSARIVAIADTFDAITHARSYSAAQSIGAAAELIGRGRGRYFDPELVDLFLLPPVLERIEKSMTEAYSPRRAGEKRRNPAARRNTPDINFRWRKQAP